MTCAKSHRSYAGMARDDFTRLLRIIVIIDLCARSTRAIAPVFPMTGSGLPNCGTGQTLASWNGTIEMPVCENCTECLEGHMTSRGCTLLSDTVCAPCKTGTFNEVPGISATCMPCTNLACPKNQLPRSCTPTSDSTCDVCGDNFWWKQLHCAPCRRCKDNEYESQPCTLRQNRRCVPRPTTSEIIKQTSVTPEKHTTNRRSTQTSQDSSNSTVTGTADGRGRSPKPSTKSKPDLPARAVSSKGLRVTTPLPMTSEHIHPESMPATDDDENNLDTWLIALSAVLGCLFAAIVIGVAIGCMLHYKTCCWKKKTLNVQTRLSHPESGHAYQETRPEDMSAQVVNGSRAHEGLTTALPESS